MDMAELEREERKCQLGRLRPGVVVYADILGFRRMCDPGRSPIEPLKALAAIRALRPETDETPAVQIHFYVLGDSFVRVLLLQPDLEQEGPWDAVERRQMLWAVDAQASFCSRGHLVQGGVATGLVYSNLVKATVYGPALCRAIELKSEKARSSGIAVDDEIAKRHAGDFHWLERQDETWFIDYLGLPPFLAGRRDTAIVPWLKRLEQHKNAVRDYYRASQDEKQRARCKRMILHHNRKVESMLRPASNPAPGIEDVRARIEACRIEDLANSGDR